jgi:hypothetical protein
MDHRTSENFSILTGLVSAVSISSKTDFKLLSPIGEVN